MTLKHDFDMKLSCQKHSKKVDLQINDSKTGYIILNRREVNYQINYRQGEIMKVENHSFKGVPFFNYLRLILTNDNDKSSD